MISALRRRRALRACAATVAVATATLLGTGSPGSAALPADETGDVSRVLQSVSVDMSSDGTLTEVDGSVVESAGDPADAEASDSSYAPNLVAGKLPVRVLTAYRTAEGAGTDLDDLQGYTGRVAIDLTVQNLTVRPEVLEYDVDGSSRSQAALVGAPLTVTASAALGDLAPARVLTEEQDNGINVTNGVLGQTTAGGTTVQWATMLAPPTLSSATEFSLVVDAKDFDVPEFDLSVQPGLVTDPSVRALVDAAFNPRSSGDLELQQRTIELIGQVNGVLARASSTISDVRSNLTSSAQTLGTQTVADLQASTESVTTNMRSLDGALQALRQDLSGTLEATGSSAVAELEQAVTTVDQMLGDTSAQPPTAQVRGNGCETTVSDPGRASSVYGSLLQVASQLDGYAKATTECKNAVKQSILDNIGPEQPTEDSCYGSNSVTCLLLGAGQTFEDIATELNALTDASLDLLQPGKYQDAIDALTEITTTSGNIDDLTTLIGDGRNGVVGAMNDAVYGPDRAAGGAPGTLERLQGDLGVVQTAINALGGVQDDVTNLGTGLDSMRQQAVDAAVAVCQLKSDGYITDAQAQEALKYLVSESCEKVDLTAPGDGNRNGLSDDSISERLAAGSVERTYLANIGTAVQNAHSALLDIKSGVDEVYSELKFALDQRYGPGEGVRFTELIDKLDGLSAILNKQDDALNAALATLEADAGQVADIEKRIDEKIAEAKEALAALVEEQTRDVYSAGGAASEELGTMLERSSQGLSNSADKVVSDSRKSLQGQKQEFAQAQAQAGNRISSEIEDGLAMISTGVNASTRDMEAATTLLIADLRKVLLDLGERRRGGGGLLGAMATNAATANTANYQLALATNQTTSYANVRRLDIAGIMLRQAQTDAAMQTLAELPAFELDLPAGADHRTVYTFSIGEGS